VATRKRKATLPEKKLVELTRINPVYSNQLQRINCNFRVDLPDEKRTVGLEYGVRKDTWDADIVKSVVEFDEYNMRGYQGPKSVILDIGAHVGGFCTTMKRVFPQSRVIALEAASFNVPVLSHNLSYSPDVEAYFNAIGSTDGNKVYVAQGAGKNTGGNCCVDAPDDVEYTTSVTLSTLASVVGVDKFDMVKLDCEGGERLILSHQPSASILAKSTYVSAEIHGNIENAISWFNSNFPNVRVKHSGANLANVYAWNDH
jgi:FkbM family methyltransferase